MGIRIDLDIKQKDFWCIIWWSRIEERTKNKLHNIFWHTSPIGRKNIKMGQNEESYVLDVKVQADSPMKNKDGSNPRTSSDLLQESEVQLINLLKKKDFQQNSKY